MNQNNTKNIYHEVDNFLLFIEYEIINCIHNLNVDKFLLSKSIIYDIFTCKIEYVDILVNSSNYIDYLRITSDSVLNFTEFVIKVDKIIQCSHVH